MLRYALTIFLSAFLLFQVQPLIAKYILPWFGGTPAVWTTCMLFFQVLLLGGYLYAHLLRTRLRQRVQVVVHVAALALAVALLPITPDAGWKPEGSADPTWRILALLAVSVGLPYFLLASTSPLLQAWFSTTHPGRRPYRLYSLSNAGSLLALVSYPFVFEPEFRLNAQTVLWSVGFGLFAALCAYCAARTWGLRAAAVVPSGGGGGEVVAEAAAPGWGTRLLWLALPACGTVMLLAVTNQMCWDVAVVPFLWVLPLSLYLLSFIFCFHSERWYFRPVYWPLLAGAMGGMLWLMFQGVDASILKQVFGYSVGLFLCCMVCHGELVRLKPHPRYLTSFYLVVSAGGALGGVFVTLVAPYAFRTYIELHIGMWLVCALAVVAFWCEKRPHRWWRRAMARFPVRLGWADGEGGVARPASLGERAKALARGAAVRASLPALLVVVLAALGALGYGLRRQARELVGNSVSLTRSFYGALRVVAEYEMGFLGVPRPQVYTLRHGRIDHGSQFVDPGRRLEPTSYYVETSGVGLTLLNYPRESGLRVGVVGLGVGTLAAYGREGDVFRFYEINPDVARLARSRFTFLADSPARCEVVLGDARLSLEREAAQDYDILVLDAFTGDAIPVHLLTREAFAVYLEHVKPRGVIAVHISNRYLDLRPVVQAIAEHYELVSATIDDDPEEGRAEASSSTWVLLSRDERFLRSQPIRSRAETPEHPPEPILWTDRYSNLFRILR
ncbi:MAG: spermidine synthase [Candidatus Brocadiia bacterium]